MANGLFLVQLVVEDLAVSTGSQRMVLERTSCLLLSQTGLFFQSSFSRDGKTLVISEITHSPSGG